MGAKTKIQWTDATWNPVAGCSHISDGCTNCYAEAMSRRFRKDWKPWTAENAKHNVRQVLSSLEQPLRWRKPRRIFVCSMGDLFHENVSEVFIEKVFEVMVLAKQHTFMVLTKRPNRMREYIETTVQAWKMPPEQWDWPPINVWLGVTAENQRTADERIPLLLQTPAAKRFVSCEPLLGPIELDAPGRPWLTTEIDHEEDTKLDWVIAGGESGPKARPMHPEWLRSIRDKCRVTGVAFFFKQWGVWMPIFHGIDPSANDPKCRVAKAHTFADGQHMWRVGKKAAGRLLDWREWNEVPKC